MKTSLIFTCSSTLALLLLLAPALHSQEKSDKEKAREALNKLLGEVQKVAGKVETKSKEFWNSTKETLGVTKEDYLKRATSSLTTMSAEIQALAESGSAVTTRDYFKMRIEALKLHLDYCKRDLEQLQLTPSEETFRVKQKSFDRSMGFLGDSISLAKEEAGL